VGGDAGIELYPADLAGEVAAAIAWIVGRYRRSGFMADVARLLPECERFGLLDAPFPGLGAVDEQRHSPALRDAAAVVRELHPHLMRPGRNGLTPFDDRLLQAEEVVAILRFAVLRVQAPAAGDPADGDDDAFGTGCGHLDLGGDRMRLVLQVQHRQR